MSPGRWPRRLGLSVALISGLATLAIEMLPLLLALLLLLFDRVTHGVMVLLGAPLEWLRSLLPAGPGALPSYQAVGAGLLPTALQALLLGLPCLAGLLLLGLRRWWLALLCWGFDIAVAALDADLLVVVVLLPGLLAVLLLGRIG